jgi:hypothetical protein
MSAMKIYVAGASSEIETARGWMKRLREAGFEVTVDWPTMIDQGGGVANDLPGEAARKAAWTDLRGVSDAEIFWMLVPEVETKGAWIELGYALSESVVVFMSGRIGFVKKCIFATLTEAVEAMSSEQAHKTAFREICEYRDRAIQSRRNDPS